MIKHHGKTHRLHLRSDEEALDVALVDGLNNTLMVSVGLLSDCMVFSDLRPSTESLMNWTSAVCA